MYVSTRPLSEKWTRYDGSGVIYHQEMFKNKIGEVLLLGEERK
jgi:hypothetical protein